MSPSLSDPVQEAGDYDVAIIGAGPAGLTAAYLLSKTGLRVHIIEQDEHYVGGISRSVVHEGFRFDIGGNCFFSKSAQVVALWNEILPHDFIERTRMSRIYYEGKFYHYPLRAFQMLWNLGIGHAALCLASYFKARFFRRANICSFEDWAINQFGARLYRIFFKTYTEKVWGMPCHEIAADWAAQRIKGLSLSAAIADGIKQILGLNKKQNDGLPAKTLRETFRYPKLGPGMMWEAALARILASGGSINMGHSLVKLQQHPGGDWLVTASAKGKLRHVRARHVISSASLNALSQTLHPEPASYEHAQALKYRDFLKVALKIRGQDVFPDNWIYIHDSNVKVGRIQNFRSWSPDMVPDPELTCVGLEYFCFAGDDLWTMADEDLIALASEEMAILGLCSRDKIIGGVVVRQEKAYPVYDEHYADHVAAIRKELEEKYPSLHLVGRNGMHRYNNQDHAMMTAMLSVENILVGRRVYDVWRVNEQNEYHEEGYEGDERPQDSLYLRLSEDQRAALSSLRDVPQGLR